MTKPELVEALQDAEKIFQVWQRHLEVFPQLEGITKRIDTLSWCISPATRKYLETINLLTPVTLNTGEQRFNFYSDGACQVFFDGLHMATIGAFWETRVSPAYATSWEESWMRLGPIFPGKDIRISLSQNSMLWTVSNISVKEFEEAEEAYIGARPAGDNGKYDALALEIVVTNLIGDEGVGVFFAGLKLKNVDGVQYVVE